jgi:hypothetical protein
MIEISVLLERFKITINELTKIQNDLGKIAQEDLFTEDTTKRIIFMDFHKGIFLGYQLVDYNANVKCLDSYRGDKYFPIENLSNSRTEMEILIQLPHTSVSINELARIKQEDLKKLVQRSPPRKEATTKIIYPVFDIGKLWGYNCKECGEKDFYWNEYTELNKL